MREGLVDDIRTLGGNRTFADVVASGSDEARALPYGARSPLAAVMPGITEVPWAGQRSATYFVGPKKISYGPSAPSRHRRSTSTRASYMALIWTIRKGCRRSRAGHSAA
jgi:hypothetical protein